ncbi:MAG: hypothetical protein GQ536_03420 [Candidatus Aminicenantes bacterium]|nr:hypothetical protein [Candidatus Aminicenantes bacterium]
MNKKWEPRQSRATTHFKFYSEKYLWGSTRSELSPDERSVWIDFLCLETLNFGVIEVYSRDQLAQQLLISRELLDRSIKKFIKSGKVKRKYNKREKKEIFAIVNWSRFQADYLTKRAKKSASYEIKESGGEVEKSDTEIQPTLKERKGKEIKSEEIKLEEIKRNDATVPESSDLTDSENPSPLHSVSNPPNRANITKKEQFLAMLKQCEGYPFDEHRDSVLFDITVTECPRINVIKQTEKKIVWWSEHPDAIRADPRKQLTDWFYEEFKFQKTGEPQRIGEIAKEIADKDHRNWVKQLLDKGGKNV